MYRYQVVRSTQILYYIINLWCPILKSICHHFNHQLPQMSKSKQPIEWQGKSSKAQSQLGGKYGLIHFSNRSPFYDNKCASLYMYYYRIQIGTLRSPIVVQARLFFLGGKSLPAICNQRPICLLNQSKMFPYMSIQNLYIN